jgi:hypothetical protein
VNKKVRIALVLASALVTFGAGHTSAHEMSHRDRAYNMSARAIALEVGQGVNVPPDYIRNARTTPIWVYRNRGPVRGVFTGTVWACGDETCYAGQVEVSGHKHFVSGT